MREPSWQELVRAHNASGPGDCPCGIAGCPGGRHGVWDTGYNTRAPMKLDVVSSPTWGERNLHGRLIDGTTGEVLIG